MPVHALSGILFLVLGGTLATLNHTRIDFSALRLPFTQAPPDRHALHTRIRHTLDALDTCGTLLRAQATLH